MYLSCLLFVLHLLCSPFVPLVLTAFSEIRSIIFLSLLYYLLSFSLNLQCVVAEDSMLQAAYCLLACLRNLFYLLKVFLGVFNIVLFTRICCSFA